ncbi:MAG TPA: ATP-binding protein [Selenomonadales bacterium]|nr:ATP-binding protein [Selenomonadales bacterium]
MYWGIFMSFLQLTMTVSTSAKLLLVLIFFYFYMQYREKYIGLWAFSWIFLSLRSALNMYPEFQMMNLLSIPALLLYQALTLASCLLIAWGTYEFTGRKLPAGWKYSAILVTAISDTGVLMGWPLPLCSLPTLAYLIAIYIQAGIIFLRAFDIPGLGRYLTGITFIVDGIHQLNFPLTMTYSSLVPFGYLFDALLRVTLAIGMLLAHFEKAKNEIIKKEQRFRLLDENSKDIIFRYSLNPIPKIDYISPSVTVITGYTPEEFYQNSEILQNLIHPSDRLLAQELPKLNSPPLILRAIRKDGTEIWIEQQTTPVYDDLGNMIAVEGIIRDITSRKQLEQELQRLDRLNIVGQMAANIGHEIRNPMTTVRGYLQVMERKKEFVAYKEDFELLLAELDRANALITEYLSLSKNRLVELKPTQLNTILTSLFPLIQADANSNNQIVRLEIEKSPDVLVDDREIRQLVLNLVRNGLEVMSKGKTLTIKTYTTHDHVVLAIQDEGPGISSEVLDKIGLPFFTTKEHGTGLGLAICYSIANRHNATITVETGPSGTTFRVHFKKLLVRR